MRSKRELLNALDLCAILDSGFLNKKKILKTALAVVKAGAGMVQFRDKSSSVKEMIDTAKALRRITKKHGAALIINDRPEVAVASHAEGLHIGQGDIDISLARKITGEKMLIGVSVQNIRQALKAKKLGADYLGVGPVFKTPIKKGRSACGIDLLCKVKAAGIPFFAIGGINSGNICKLAKKGFNKVAVIRDICSAKDPFRNTRRLKEALS